MPDAANSTDTPADPSAANTPPLSADLWREMVQNVAVGIVLFDRDLRVHYANPAALEVLHPGATLPEQLTGNHPDETARLTQMLKSVWVSNEPVVIPRMPCTTPGGKLFLAQLTARAIPGASSEGRCIMALHEITEISNLEQRLAASERMAAVGRLAAKVAHELNSPLDGIMRYVALAQRRLRENNYDDLPRYLDDIGFGLKRMAEIVRELLEFGQNASAASPLSDLIYITDQSVRTMQGLADRAGVEILVSHRHTLTVRAGSNMYQVLCNIIKNAIDAMPQGGVLTIINDREGEWAVVRIQDTGRGIRPEDMPYIFEPFFSTKPLGQGTGLGLAVCKEIMEKMGGAIAVTNRPAGGCEFSLRLPGTASKGAIAEGR